MLCGQMSLYNQDGTFTNTPLHDNQIAILEYIFIPDIITKKNFTINFKYQIFSEFRGDYFYFQYSIDNGKTYYNLLRQSGDVNNLKSVALLDKFRWKSVSFYLPYNTIYKFRWIYNKDSDFSSSYDTVFLGDIFINYLNPVIEYKNDVLNIYANNFIGYISSGQTEQSSVKNFLLPFLKKNENQTYGYVDGDIIINGTMNNYINPAINANSNLIYGNMNTFYRKTTNFYNTTFDTILINSTNNIDVNKSWRLYTYTNLKTKLSDLSWNALSFNAKSDFLNNIELALLSSQSKNSSANDGLKDNDSAIFTIGPLNYNDLMNNNHQLEFKYFIDSEYDYDGLGIVMYDYQSNNDIDVLNVLVKIVDLYGIYGHYQLYDLIDKYDTDRILIRQNILSYPSSELGFSKTNGFLYGWNDISIQLNKITPAHKRIIIFFYSKDSSVSRGDDIVLIHDIKFTFKQTTSSFKLNRITNDYLIIDIPGIGQRSLYLSTHIPSLV